MTRPEPESRGYVCTFYSYKGGVGRSMALANVAVLMARWGHRVLVVDWDLESPGLGRYFDELAAGKASRAGSRGGIVEIVTELSRDRAADWKDSIISFRIPGASHDLDFIPAGRQDGEYAQRLQRLDWENLFARHDFGDRLEAIRNDWLRSYDYVLIDSRTGITDAGGICTIYLPDILVGLFVANHQSVEGIADVIRRARRARAKLPVNRGALACIPVPARDESRTEYEQSAEWRREFERLLADFYTDFLPRDVSPAQALSLLRIPNVPYWSFGERLPALTESPYDPSGITYYYTILARLLTTGLSWHDSTPAEPASSKEAADMRVWRPKISAAFGRVARHPVISALISAAVAAAVAVPVYTAVTSSPCGPGMTAAGPPGTCVGLDLSSTPMRDKDPLSMLEAAVATMDSGVTRPFATIVLLEDFTPNPNYDNKLLPELSHSIEGAITAVKRVNSQAVGHAIPRIKLLLANFGSGASSWRQAVTAIESAQQSQHIVAVTGIGQSLNNTRAAVAALSQGNITTIGSDVTADDMNLDLAGKLIRDFFRVAPDNTDEADIAVQYIQQNYAKRHPRPKIMLIQDTNPSDSYSLTLARAYQKKLGRAVRYHESYISPTRPLSITRDQYVSSQFATMQSAICAGQPDLIYFAGRGSDLASFLRQLATSGCLLPTITVMTGDDASNIIGEKFPAPSTGVHVLFTALATGGEWSGPHSDKSAAANYYEFMVAFQDSGFLASYLSDGEAMMEYDAVLVAVTAVREDPAAITNPGTVAAYVRELRCSRTVPGASGFIAIGPDGNPIDKVMPIQQINSDGSTILKANPQGPSGRIDYFTKTC